MAGRIYSLLRCSLSTHSEMDLATAIIKSSVRVHTRKSNNARSTDGNTAAIIYLIGKI